MTRKGTVIWVSLETKKRLEKLRSLPRETVGDVVKRLLDEHESKEVA